MERVKVQQAFKYPLALDMEPFVEGRAWDGNDNSDESQVRHGVNLVALGLGMTLALEMALGFEMALGLDIALGLETALGLDMALRLEMTLGPKMA